MSTWLGQLWDETKDDVSAAWGRLSSLSSDDGRLCPFLVGAFAN